MPPSPRAFSSSPLLGVDNASSLDQPASSAVQPEAATQKQPEELPHLVALPSTAPAEDDPRQLRAPPLPRPQPYKSRPPPLYLSSSLHFLASSLRTALPSTNPETAVPPPPTSYTPRTGSASPAAVQSPDTDHLGSSPFDPTTRSQQQQAMESNSSSSQGRSRSAEGASVSRVASPTHLTMNTGRHLSPLAVSHLASSSPSSGSTSGASTPPQPSTRPVGGAHTHRALGALHPITTSSPHSLPSHAATPPPVVTGSSIAVPSAASVATASYSQSLASPCFIHSHLDNTLNDFVKRDTRSLSQGSKRSGGRQSAGEGGRELQRTKSAESKPAAAGEPQSPETVSSVAVDDESYDEDDEEANSWTRQLAETAVSVREMSRQLGRARVVSHIQSVMIVTKARDNQLTKLTRELALWLMRTPRNGKDRGLVVYVDTQLQKSKRFDAAGMQRDHPELFRPVSSRRYSRTASSASLATDGAPIKRSGVSTPGHHHGSMTPLSMTGLNEALLKRNNSISSSAGGRKGDEGDEGQLRYWTNDMCRKSPHLFDFVITLGGDGTVLYTSWLFQQIVPPVIPFALGSLGFLTNFDYCNFRPVLDAAIDSGVRVNLRMRFTCTVYRSVTEDEHQANKRQAVKSGRTGGIFMKSLTTEEWDAIESGRPLNDGKGTKKDKAVKCFSTRAVESFEVLNDLVVDRGPSPFVSQLELFGDEHHMTTVQADGLTVSTPTGSTAYSLSAGGSLVHPEIPAILITPICPHTLSFRPMLLPDSMELRICVPYNSRSTAWASFDGRGRVELRQGDHIKVTASPYPFPTVCADKQSTDWFHSIARTLKWNERQRQKSFVILEEGRKKPSSPAAKETELQPEQRSSATASKGEGSNPSSGSGRHATFANPPQNGVSHAPSLADETLSDEEEDEVDDDDEADEDGEEEEYDIDDISEANTTNASPAITPSDPTATIPPLPPPTSVTASMFPQSYQPSTSSPSTTSSTRGYTSSVNTSHPPQPLSSSSSSRPPAPPPATFPSSASPTSYAHSHSEHTPHFALSSASSSTVSLDIHEDPHERFVHTPPTRTRRRSSAAADVVAGGGGGGGGASSATTKKQAEEDGSKSGERAFAVVGQDSGSSESGEDGESDVTDGE